MFFDPALFSLAGDLQRSSDTIRREYAGLNAPIITVSRNCPIDEFIDKLEAHGENGWVESWQVGATEPNPDWLTYAIYVHGRFAPGVAAKVPWLKDFIEKRPACEACGFTMMRPRSVLGKHTHPSLGGDRLVLHLGIDVEPGSSFISVDGEFREEREGKVLVFDASREHFAFNAGSRDRAILYMEFDRSKL